jgi:hypothetical protein
LGDLDRHRTKLLVNIADSFMRTWDRLPEEKRRLYDQATAEVRGG